MCPCPKQKNGTSSGTYLLYNKIRLAHGQKPPVPVTKKDQTAFCFFRRRLSSGRDAAHFALPAASRPAKGSGNSVMGDKVCPYAPSTANEAWRVTTEKTKNQRIRLSLCVTDLNGFIKLVLVPGGDSNSYQAESIKNIFNHFT